jgi:pimeloyl-ACP methyl ester carboxylesterase
MANLVILPGLDGTGARFADFIRAIAPAVDARVIPFPTDEPLGYAQLETLVRRALPSDRRFVLLAESFSGPLAIRIGADPPRGLAGVILCGTFAKNPYPWLRLMGPLAVRLPVKSLPRWVRAPLMWGSGNPRRAPPRGQRAISAVTSPVIRRRIGEVLSVDETARLGAIELPILVLIAARDRLLPRAAAHLLLQSLPLAQFEEIDGPHLLLQSRPSECAVPVLRFVRRWN